SVADETQLGAALAYGRALVFGNQLGEADHRPHPQPAGCEGERTPVVAGRYRYNSPLTLFRGEHEQPVDRTPQLECTVRLKACELEEDRGGREGAQAVAIDQGRATQQSGGALAGQVQVAKRG